MISLITEWERKTRKTWFPEKLEKTRTQIVTVNNYVKNSLSLNKKIVISFVDTEKATDNINWNNVQCPQSYKGYFENNLFIYTDRRIILQLYKN